jgi:hypothetical protein
MTDELHTALNLILDGQHKELEMLMQMQVQIAALTNVLVSLDPRAALLLSTQIETLTEQHREQLAKAKKDIALLRATVSNLVQ